MSVPVRTPVPAEPARPGRWRPRRTAALAAVVGLAVGLIGFALTRPAAAGVVGAGSYADTLPAGRVAADRLRLDLDQPAPVRDRQRAGRRACRPTTGGRRCSSRAPTARTASRCTPTRSPTTRSPAGSASPTTPPRRSAAPPTGVGEYHYPYVQDILVGVGRAELARRQGRRLERLDRHAVLERRRPHDEGHHRPRPAVRVLPDHRRQRADHRPPARRRVWSNSGATDRLHGQRPRLRRLRADRCHLDGQRHHASPRRWPARASSPSRCCRPRVDAGRPTRTSLANTYGTYAHAHVTGTRVSYALQPGDQHGDHDVRVHHHRPRGHRDRHGRRALPAPVELPRPARPRSRQTYVSAARRDEGPHRVTSVPDVDEVPPVCCPRCRRSATAPART